MCVCVCVCERERERERERGRERDAPDGLGERGVSQAVRVRNLMTHQPASASAAASERRGNTSKPVEDLNLKAKARMTCSLPDVGGAFSEFR